jgi:DNA modification methylase
MTNITREKMKMATVDVNVSDLVFADWNPRKIKEEGFQTLCKSIEDDPDFLQARPLIVSDRTGKLVVVAGNMRGLAAQTLKMQTVPAIVVTLTEEKEKAWSLKDNLHQGEWDWDMLAEFDETILSGAGFTSEELDEIFAADETPEPFDLAKELQKLKIDKIEIQKGDVFDLNGSRVMCGDSTIAADMAKLMGDEKADLCLTDPPYILDYLHGKKKSGEAVTGFGAKRDRRYLETDSLPDNFTELWMKNVKAAAKDNFHIIVYENWKNIRTIWGEMEKYWKVKNMIVWHLPNRMQGFAGKYKFFSKHDIAMVGSSHDAEHLNLETEDELLENEYSTALYAISGKPHWEGYEKGKKICPTDFIEHIAADEKSSGQGIIFGTKPIEILIPYIKVLTKRGDLVLEPFGGSGSSLVSALKMQRRCFLMEKSPVYLTVILKRVEKTLGIKAQKI